MADENTVLVRLQPYDRSRGRVLRQYTVLGLLFRESEGWYEVERELAELLANEKQPPVGNTPPDMVPPAFDIREHTEAVALEEAEELAKIERAKAINPRKLETPAGVLSTSDLQGDEPEEEQIPKPTTRRQRSRRR